MKLVYLGNFLHPWTTETHVCRDAERIPGVNVVRVQEQRRASATDLNVIDEACNGADLLIYQRTWGLHHEAIDLWRDLESRGVKTASYHLDLYVGLDREHTIAHDPFWLTGTVFTADGDPETAAWMADRGIDHRWLPAAIESGECFTGTARPASAQVVFVGSKPDTYHPEWPWRRELLDGLRARYGRKFLRLPTNDQRVYGKQLNDLYASVPVVIGDSLALPGHMNYWSDRFYETLGRGGYLIGPNIPGISRHFTSGEHLDLYDIGDLDHVFQLVDQALNDPDGAREIARVGQAHVRAHHTYTHRMRALLTSLGFVGPVGPVGPVCPSGPAAIL